MSYSKSLRKRTIDFVIEKKNSMRSASKIFGGIHYTMKEWIKIFKKTGELSPIC